MIMEPKISPLEQDGNIDPKILDKEQQQNREPVDEIIEKLGNLFLDDNYSINSVLKLVHMRHISLSQLRDLLQKHQKNLNQTSLELFNTNYDRFYKLSCIISCLAEPIQRLVDPLQVYYNKLSELCENHNSYLATIDDRLVRLESTSKNKEIAIHLIELIKRYERLEKQLKSIKLLNSTATEIVDRTLDFVSRIDLDAIERLSRQTHYTLKEVVATQPSDDELILIRKTLKDDLSKLREYLDKWLYELFQESINTKHKVLIEFVLQIHLLNGSNELDKIYLEHIFSELSKYLEDTINQQPFGVTGSPQFKLKICAAVFELVKRCWLPETYIELLEIGFVHLACRLLHRFSEWLGKLRLSDFKVTGWSTREHQESNFLAKQVAAMRLLIEDCSRLTESIREFCETLPSGNEQVTKERKDLITNSLNVVNSGLNNVRSLQRLMER